MCRPSGRPSTNMQPLRFRQIMDLTGRTFGRLTVIKFDEKSPTGKVKWLCRCTCGKMISVFRANLQRGTTQSCGCLKREYLAELRRRESRHGHTSNGRSPTWIAWSSMKSRCDNPENESYDAYGGRGITYCERWTKFENFLEDMGERPDGLSLDRIDNDGPYSKENCRWATVETQANNRRTNRLIEHDGKVLTIAQWSKFTGIKDVTLRKRFEAGWSAEKALTTPVTPNS